MRQSVEHLLRTIDYSFSDPQLVENALTHRSVGGINNERMEFLGDAVLGFVIAEELYKRFDRADEGQLSRLRATLVKGESLADVAHGLELGSYLHLGTGELRSGGQRRSSILSDALEALFAAIYIDGGYEAVRKVILNLLQEKLEALSPGCSDKDPKTRLQEHLQAQRNPLPVYEILDISGEQHEQTFSVKCTLAHLGLESQGRGTSRRKAEQDAAAEMLARLQSND